MLSATGVAMARVAKRAEDRMVKRILFAMFVLNRTEKELRARFLSIVNE